MLIEEFINCRMYCAFRVLKVGMHMTIIQWKLQNITPTPLWNTVSMYKVWNHRVSRHSPQRTSNLMDLMV